MIDLTSAVIAPNLLSCNLDPLSYIAPPGIPQDRVKMLRDAFWHTVNSVEYKRQAKKVFRIDLDHLRGEVLARFMKSVMEASPEAVTLLKKLLTK